MRTSLRSSVVAAVVALAVAAAPTSAQVPLGSGAAGADNSVGPVGRDSFFPDPITGTVAQTFLTPSGSWRLLSFTFYLNDFFGGANFRLQVNVFAFTTDRIVGPALYTSDVRFGSGDQTGTPQPFTFLVSPGLTFTTGTTYAFLLRTAGISPDGSTNFVFTTTGNTIPQGRLFLSNGSTDAQLGAPGAFTASTADTYGLDAAMLVTFAPEPGSIVLVAAGLVGVAVLSRRRPAQM